MSHAKTFTVFNEWINAVQDADVMDQVKTDPHTYEVEQDGFVMAYWDRDLHVGAISNELFI